MVIGELTSCSALPTRACQVDATNSTTPFSFCFSSSINHVLAMIGLLIARIIQLLRLLGLLRGMTGRHGQLQSRDRSI